MQVLFPITGVFLLFLGAVLAMRIFQPLERAARTRRAPLQWAIVDFLSLFVMVQLSVAAFSWAGAEHTERGIVVVYVLGWMLCGVLWWSTVRTLSRAGVRAAWRRFAVTALAAPVGVIGALVTPILTLLLLACLVYEDSPLRPRHVAWIAWSDAALLAGAVVSAWYIRRVARDIDQESFESAEHGDEGHSCG